MGSEDRPRRLTPIGDELEFRHVEVGTPSLRDRWQRRRRLLPTPKTWYGAIGVGAVRLAILLAVVIGIVFAIAELGHWTDRGAMGKVFIVAGGACVAGLMPSRVNVVSWRTSTAREQDNTISLGILLAIVGACLLAIGFYLDATK